MSMPSDDVPQFRMMLRQEGDWWNAYIGLANTTEGAIHMAGLHMKLAAQPEFQEKFMELMADSCKFLLENAMEGVTAELIDVRPAPAHERAGRA